MSYLMFPPSSDTPSTGVINNNSIEWLNDELYDAIDLDIYRWQLEQEALGLSEEEIDKLLDETWDGDTSSHDYLIGDWILEDELWAPDPDGEYAAICRESVTQVVYSRYILPSTGCSPCYPHQCDLDSPGDYPGYCLPPDLLGRGLPLDEYYRGAIELADGKGYILLRRKQDE